MPKIKKCPFCGGSAKLRKIGQGYAVKCTKCGATGRKEYPEAGVMTICMTQSLAIVNWNTREQEAAK